MKFSQRAHFPFTALDVNVPVVYCIENKRSGKRYIGSAFNFQSRIRNHLYSLKRGTHHNEALQIDYDAGDNFEVNILSCFSPEISRTVLEIIEYLFIRDQEADVHGYNGRTYFHELSRSEVAELLTKKCAKFALPIHQGKTT